MNKTKCVIANLAKNIAIALACVATSASFAVAQDAPTPEPQYVFRVPISGMQGKTTAPACAPVNSTPVMGGGITIPAGCHALSFNLVGFSWLPNGGYWGVCDRVEGTYRIPSSPTGAVVSGFIEAGGPSTNVVSLYVNGTRVATAACVGSGVETGVMNGAVVTRIVTGPSDGTDALVSYQ